jgi:hypothetical protein
LLQSSVPLPLAETANLYPLDAGISPLLSNPGV